VPKNHGKAKGGQPYPSRHTGDIRLGATAPENLGNPAATLNEVLQTAASAAHGLLKIVQPNESRPGHLKVYLIDETGDQYLRATGLVTSCSVHAGREEARVLVYAPGAAAAAAPAAAGAAAAAPAPVAAVPRAVIPAPPAGIAPGVANLIQAAANAAARAAIAERAVDELMLDDPPVGNAGNAGNALVPR
jgi:hypothetical protein